MDADDNATDWKNNIETGIEDLKRLDRLKDP